MIWQYYITICFSDNRIIQYSTVPIIIFVKIYICIFNGTAISMDKDVGLLVLFIVMVLAVMAGIFLMDTVKVNIGGA